MAAQVYVTVSNQAEFLKALGARTADTTIVLKEGNYGDVKFNARESALGIKIEAADPAKPPVFDGLSISNANGVQISGVTFTPPGDMRFLNGLTLRGCEDVVLTQNVFEGAPGSKDSLQRGLYIDKSSNVIVHDNDFSGQMRGAVITQSDGVKVTSNTVTDMRSEGFNFAGVKNVEIAHNKMSAFTPVSGDHADFIQFWTNGIKAPSENIHIHDNQLIQTKSGLSVQGIFMGNEDNVPFRNVVIEDNIIQSGMPHGVMVDHGIGVRVENNVALGVEGAMFRVSVSVIESVDAVVRNNTSNSLILTNTTNVSETANAIISKQINGHSLLDADQLSQLRAESVFVRGTDGADRLMGTNRDDVIIGNAGADTLNGGRGDDLLIGGAGADVLAGGAGADRFVFSGLDLKGFESDRVMDLNLSQGDTLEFCHFGSSALRTSGRATLFDDGSRSTFVVDSIQDLMDLGKLSNVDISRRGTTDTLVMRITDTDSDVLELQMSNLFSQFLQAGGHLG